MLALFHRNGGLATASRAGLRRSGASERLPQLYSKFDAAFRSAQLFARAVSRFVIDLNLFPETTHAGAAGLAFACTTSRHHIPGAQ
jgi:hypothetical protein